MNSHIKSPVAKSKNCTAFRRGCQAYSSLPYQNSKKNHKSEFHDSLRDDFGASVSEVEQIKSSHDEDSGEAISRQILPHNSTTENKDEHVFGLSNNLSTESIRGACEFYDDEVSDDDLIETRSIPECFQKQSSLQTSLRGFCFRLGNQKNLIDSYPVQSIDNIMTASQQNEAVNVLNDLDDFLDVHTNWDVLQYNNANPASFEIECKIEDCLLDLDNYLDKMDVSSGNCNTNQLDEEIKEPENAEGSTCPISDLLQEVTQNIGILETPNNKFQRRQSVRQTVSEADCELTTPGQQQNGQMGSRSSMRITTHFMLPDATAQQAQSNSSINENEEVRHNNVISNMQIISSPTPTTNPIRTTDLRRCYSQIDFIADSHLVNPIQMLTQEHIFNNLLAQNDSTRQEGRPRQFGRRVEGYPGIQSITNELLAGNNCMIVNCGQRPMSAPATNTDRVRAEIVLQEMQNSTFRGSPTSSVRSSRNHSPISLASSLDSSSTVPSINGNMETTLVVTDNLALDPENMPTITQSGYNDGWPHSFSRALALIPCTLGLFNICRFAVLTEIYGGNFLLQFILMSILFGVPMFWLQMCLGAKIKSGPISMWKISPICKGIGISLVMAQCFIALYSTVAVAWTMVYLRDSFPTKTHNTYRWQEAVYPHRHSSNSSSNLTECVADYFNIVVLQRFQFVKPMDSDKKFHINDRLAFNLAFLWTAVFLVLCKGLKSFGKVVFVISTVPLIMLMVVTGKLLCITDLSKMQNIFTATDFDDFLINSKTWSAAAQEVLLTWGLLGPSVIAISSRIHKNGNKKSTLRRDAILVVFITFFGLALSAIFGLASMQLLHQNKYVYIPGSYERPESYSAVHSLKSTVHTDLFSFPLRWIPHYSSFVGEIYRRVPSESYRESGYQALRLITELFPAVVTLARDSFSWVWTVIVFVMFGAFGLAQLCVLWKPMSNMLGNSITGLLLSCVTGLLLSVPLTTEMGITIFYYMDLVIGGAWFLPILWATQIFGVFLIRGRPYNGDDLVNDLRMSGSMSAFLALSWNVLLPIGLITLAVVSYKTSNATEFFYWRGRSYFSYWARKVAALTQVGFLLLVPIIAIIQICRYLTRGPPDILDRIQLLYRPMEGANEGSNDAMIGRRRTDSNDERNNVRTNPDLNIRNTRDDAPPKYTPPPSYTTATGARLAKMLHQSIRRSVRRILRAPERVHSTIINSNEVQQQQLPSEQTRNNEGTMSVATEIDSQPLTIEENVPHRSLSFGHKMKQRCQSEQRPSSATPALGGNANVQRPFTAEDVVTVLRSSTRGRLQNDVNISLETEHENSFCSVENLILNMQPLGESAAVGVNSLNMETSNE